MVRLIQKSGYIKAGGASGYMKYIATRERVERLEGSGPVTKGQRQLIGSGIFLTPLNWKSTVTITQHRPPAMPPG